MLQFIQLGIFQTQVFSVSGHTTNQSELISSVRMSYSNTIQIFILMHLQIFMQVQNVISVTVCKTGKKKSIYFIYTKTLMSCTHTPSARQSHGFTMSHSNQPK